MQASLAVLKSGDKDHFFGTRVRARLIRGQIENLLATGTPSIIIDFSGVSGLTQSFVDELVGQVVLRQGPSVISRFQFKGCSKDTQTIIQLVLEDRVRGFNTRQLLPTQQLSKMTAH